VLAATEQAGRDPAERVQLNAFAIEGNTGRHDGAPWPARLPTPSPMTIFTNAATVTLADASGTGVGIDGAGLLSGVPTTLVESRARHELVAWAGPWPLSGPWWRRSLRHSRLQVLTDANCALLLDYQDRNWRLVGRYD
jgi:protein ImuB